MNNFHYTITVSSCIKQSFIRSYIYLIIFDLHFKLLKFSSNCCKSIQLKLQNFADGMSKLICIHTFPHIMFLKKKITCNLV